MNKVTPFLWFDKNAEEAANHYLAIFPNAKKLNELRAPMEYPSGPKGAVVTIALEIEGQQVTFMNGGPGHPLTESFSFVIGCKDQEELDYYWEKIGGTPMQCGWIRDPFGVCWQICPHNIGELVRHPKAFQAMMQMVKLDIAALETAAKS